MPPTPHPHAPSPAPPPPRPSDILRQLQQSHTLTHDSLQKKIQRELSYLINPSTSPDSRHPSIYHFSIHPLPFILPAEDWRTLSEAFSQRLRAWNIALTDIFSEQSLIRQRILPHRLIYNDPSYLRPILGIKPIGDTPIRIAAIDFVHDSQGQWHVLEEIFSQPYGIGIALHLRQSLGEIYTRELSSLPIESPSAVPALIQENLQNCGLSFSHRPRLALLTLGPQSPSYADQAILARMIGIPLIQPDELLVLQGQLFLKTIDGLQPIEILLRFIPAQNIDPVSIPSQTPHQGIPGITSCLRKGTVAIANAPSADLLQNRALTTYTPHLIRHLLHQHPILPDLYRAPLTDIDVREQLFDDWPSYIIKPTHPHPNTPSLNGALLSQDQRRHWQQIIEQNPSKWIIQKNLLHHNPPHDPIILRLFALADHHRITLLPCALTRSLQPPPTDHTHPFPPTPIRDTWILQPTPHTPTPQHPDPPTTHHRHPIELSLPPQTHEIVGERLRLSSRTAESLLWISRYLTRAATTTQLLRTLLQIRATSDPQTTAPKTWQPLWETLAAATGHPTTYFEKNKLTHPSQLSHYILLSQENNASAYHSIRLAHQNTLASRESIPTELFTLITDLYHLLHTYSTQPPHSLDPILNDLSLHNSLIQTHEQITGAALHHLLRDDPWHFWNIGHHIEQAIFTTITFRQLILPLRSPTQDPSLIHDTLIRLFACQYAHRKHHPHRPTLQSIASILLTLPTFPRSLAFHYHTLHHHLTTCFPLTTPTPTTPAIHTLHHLTTLHTLPLHQMCTPKNSSLPIADWLAEETQHLHHLANLITDHHIHHYHTHLLSHTPT
ncbi:MAG: circularly permuted type 2 ATP-grasp protein [Verrucomicrobiae bacterium]|nr:circularly permuted type 2 ATP-grasp protein [Verrucomicrobiae bacterium]